jgi:hypothetical protein
MASVDKAKFLQRLSGGSDSYSEPVPGEPTEPMAEEDEGGELSCGEQLLAAVKAGDAAGVDAALREAAAKYGK